MYWKVSKPDIFRPHYELMEVKAISESLLYLSTG